MSAHHATRPDAGDFSCITLHDSRIEINADGEGGHRNENSNTSGSASARNSQTEECDVPSHESSEDFAEGEKADRIDRAGRKRQRVEQQVAKTDVIRKR